MANCRNQNSAAADLPLWIWRRASGLFGWAIIVRLYPKQTGTLRTGERESERKRDMQTTGPTSGACFSVEVGTTEGISKKDHWAESVTTRIKFRNWPSFCLLVLLVVPFIKVVFKLTTGQRTNSVDTRTKTGQNKLSKQHRRKHMKPLFFVQIELNFETRLCSNTANYELQLTVSCLSVSSYSRLTVCHMDCHWHRTKWSRGRRAQQHRNSSSSSRWVLSAAKWWWWPRWDR